MSHWQRESETDRALYFVVREAVTVKNLGIKQILDSSYGQKNFSVQLISLLLMWKFNF